ncbi:MAG: MarR family transcriptional regulator [bacterium]|nr:MarR family transcriptional regulator [bacterium]
MSSFEENSKQLTEFILQLNYSFMTTEKWGAPPDVDFNFREVNVLFYLGCTGPSIMREISDRLGVAVSTLTGIIDRMVQKELVYRERHDEDRRIVKVGLTEKGKAIHDWHIASHSQVSREMLVSLSDSEQQAVLTLMKKITEYLSTKASTLIVEKHED